MCITECPGNPILTGFGTLFLDKEMISFLTNEFIDNHKTPTLTIRRFVTPIAGFTFHFCVIVNHKISIKNVRSDELRKDRVIHYFIQEHIGLALYSLHSHTGLRE